MTLADRLIARAAARPPDFIIGGAADPYLRRWWLIPRNRVCNVFLHHFLRSDEDRALHDHPWPSVSWLFDGDCTEHTIAAGGIHHRTVLHQGAWRFRSGRFAHRIELHAGPCWTLFMTGPVYREWYFHCPEQGLVHWRDFTDSRDKGSTGKGCNQ